jgi:hypothetical protein
LLVRLHKARVPPELPLNSAPAPELCPLLLSSVPEVPWIKALETDRPSQTLQALSPGRRPPAALRLQIESSVPLDVPWIPGRNCHSPIHNRYSIEARRYVSPGLCPLAAPGLCPLAAQIADIFAKRFVLRAAESRHVVPAPDFVRYLSTIKPGMNSVRSIPFIGFSPFSPATMLISASTQ